MIKQRPNLLSPKDTEFVFPAFLTDVANIDEPNYNGDYYAEFVPFDTNDYHRLDSFINETVDRLNSQVTEGDGREFVASHESTRNGHSLYFEQCFTPKISEHLSTSAGLKGTVALLKVYLRDASNGKVYISCSYIDPYIRPIEEPSDTENVSYIDW